MRKLINSFKIFSLLVTLSLVGLGAFAWKTAHDDRKRSRKLKKHFHGFLDNLLPEAILAFVE